jgi:hypothetical protein
MKITTLPQMVFCLLCCLMAACTPVYSPYVYDQTAELKTQSMSLLDKANEPYDKQLKKIQQLQDELESIRMQETMRKRNSLKVKQWNAMLDTTGYLLNGTLTKWQRDTVLTETFLSLQRKLVGEAFELMQETEKQRLK